MPVTFPATSFPNNVKCISGFPAMPKGNRLVNDESLRKYTEGYLLDICDNISLKTLCPLGDGAVCSAVSFITKFREEFKQHIDHKCCPVNKSFITEVNT